MTTGLVAEGLLHRGLKARSSKPTQIAKAVRDENAA
jgi:hypothetical protein